MGPRRGGGPEFLRPPLQNFPGPLHNILNISTESSAQAQSIGTLFEEIRLNGGSVDKPTSQRQMRLGAGRGVSQAKGAAIHSTLPG